MVGAWAKILTVKRTWFTTDWETHSVGRSLSRWETWSRRRCPSLPRCLDHTDKYLIGPFPSYKAHWENQSWTDCRWDCRRQFIRRRFFGRLFLVVGNDRECRTRGHTHVDSTCVVRPGVDHAVWFHLQAQWLRERQLPRW